MFILLVIIIVSVSSFIIGLLLGEAITQKNCLGKGFLHILGRGEPKPPTKTSDFIDPLINPGDFWGSEPKKKSKRKGKRKGK